MSTFTNTTADVEMKEVETVIDTVSNTHNSDR